jgi:hypothetical protein
VFGFLVNDAAPLAAQRASLQEYGGSDAGAVVRTKVLNVEDDALGSL